MRSRNRDNACFSTLLMENGDRFFSFASVVAHRTGLDEFTSNTVGYITGGAGKLDGIQGVLRTTAKTHPNAGTLEVDTVRRCASSAALPPARGPTLSHAS